MPDMRTMVRSAIWLLPASAVKNALLRRLGDEIDRSASAGPNLVWGVRLVRLAAGSRLGGGNVLRNLRLVEVGPGARVGSRNTISSHPVYPKLYPDGARLTVATGATVTDHHHLDCAGGIAVERLARIGGQGTQVLTHSIDLDQDVQAAHPVVIGARSFVGGGALVLGGAVLPPRSFLVPGSVLLPHRAEPVAGLWQGTPASRTGPVDDPWFARGPDEAAMPDPQVPATSAPSTSAPSTSTPSTSAPSTSTPSTSAPSTSAPSTSRAVRRRRAGRPTPTDLARLVVWLLPASPGKNAMLRRLGHQVHPRARATPNLVWRVAALTMAEGSRIADGNRVIGVGRISLARDATIGRWNRVVASAGGADRPGSLDLAVGAKITGRHLIDASAGVRVETFSSVAGRESVLDSVGRAPRAAAPITVGARSFVGTRCRLEPGAALAPRSVLAAGSVLTAVPADQVVSGLWAGNPARRRRSVQGQWFDRDRSSTTRVFVPTTGETVEDAF